MCGKNGDDHTQDVKSTLANVCQEVKNIKNCLEETRITLKAVLAKLNGSEDTQM